MSRDKLLDRLRKKLKKLVKRTSRKDHQKPLSHQEEQYKIEHGQLICDDDHDHDDHDNEE